MKDSKMLLQEVKANSAAMLQALKREQVWFMHKVELVGVKVKDVACTFVSSVDKKIEKTKETLLSTRDGPKYPKENTLSNWIYDGGMSA